MSGPLNLTPATLRTWAESQPEAWPQRAAILAVCEERDALREAVKKLLGGGSCANWVEAQEFGKAALVKGGES